MYRELTRSELKAVSGGVAPLNPQQTCASMGMVVQSVAVNIPASTVSTALGATVGVTLGVNGTGTATDPTNLGVTVTCAPPPPPPASNCSNSSSAPVKTSDASGTTTGAGEIAGGPGDDGSGSKLDQGNTGIC